MDGEIEVDSGPERGTCFTVRLAQDWMVTAGEEEAIEQPSFG
jgi:hypothetical protein